MLRTQKLTYRDYATIPDDGQRHEVLDGDPIVTPSPNVLHQEVSRRIQFQLYVQIELTRLGNVIDAPCDVELERHTIVQPDLIVVLHENRIITPARIKGVPNHLIEIVSPATEAIDRGRKFELYQRAGVSEYWIVDADEHDLAQFVLVAGKYEQREHANEVHAHYLPNVVIKLNEVW